MKATTKEVVGIIPAAGYATRLAPLPFSKELYPVSLQRECDGRMRPRAVSQWLLESMRNAGVKKTFFVLREGKWDIPTYYKDGSALLDMDIAYLLARVPFGVPFTLDQAYPFVKDATVALGFPDILFQPVSAFARLLDRLAETGADVVLGTWNLVPPDQQDDRLLIDRDGRVQRVDVKSKSTELSTTWVIAVWNPTFTQFVHDYVNGVARNPPGSGAAEPVVGDVLSAAVEHRLHIDTVSFPSGRYLDIGTPAALATLYADDTWGSHREDDEGREDPLVAKRCDREGE